MVFLGSDALLTVTMIIDFHLEVKLVGGAHFSVVGLKDVHDAEFLLNGCFFIRNNRFVGDQIRSEDFVLECF
jgi:hypothetical protein